MNHFFVTKNNLLVGIGVNALNLRNIFFDHNKFDILSDELGNGELSEDSIVGKFINTTNSIAKDLSITSSVEIRKAMF